MQDALQLADVPLLGSCTGAFRESKFVEGLLTWGRSAATCTSLRRMKVVPHAAQMSCPRSATATSPPPLLTNVLPATLDPGTSNSSYQLSTCRLED